MARETLTETMARLYRDMTPEQIASHQDWVRRFNASDAGKAAAADREERRAWIAREAERRPLTDEQVVAEVVAIIQRGGTLADAVQCLHDAGFRRED